MASDVQTLGSLCSLIVDCPHSTPVWTESGFVVLRNQNIKHGRLDISSPSFTDASHFAARNRRAKPTFGDIVITREAPMGDVCMVPAGLECCLGQRQVLLRPNRSLVSPRFLHYALQSSVVQNQIAWSEGTGSTVSNLRIPVLKALNIPVPQRDVQDGVAEILGALDDRIDLLRQTNPILEAIAQALFKSWFVDFGPVRARAEGLAPVGIDADAAALFTDEFEESELGLVPKGWRAGRIADVLAVLETGRRPKGGVAAYSAGVPSIGAESINGIGVFDFSKTKFVPQEFFSSMKSGKPNDLDVLLYKDGGKPGVFKPRLGMFGGGFPFEEYAINEHVFLLRGASFVPQEFLYFWMLEERVLQLLRNAGNKAAIPGINRSDVQGLPVLIAPDSIYSEFQVRVGPMFQRILNNSKKARSLEQLRDTLLPRLISGKLRLPEAEALIEDAVA